MGTTSSDQVLCPYCNSRTCSSDDHVFLEAIGGRKTIRACKPCNDLFGHSFEGSAVATFFHPLLIQLGGVGIPVIDTGARWRQAFVGEDGMIYNALPDENGYKLESVNVVVNKDRENPKALHAIVGDNPLGRRHLKQFLDPKKFRITSMERRQVAQPKELTLNWGFNPDLRLTALKMAFAVASIAFPADVPQFAIPREELLAADIAAQPTSVALDLRDHATLDALRDDLCHVIYVETSDEGIQAFVQFFGAVQVWMKLGSLQTSGDRHEGFLATLDPITGAEVFRKVQHLDLPPFRAGLVDALLPIRKLNLAAARRGAKTNEMIKVKEIRVDGELKAPVKPWCLTSWTGDILKKKD